FLPMCEHSAAIGLVLTGLRWKRNRCRLWSRRQTGSSAVNPPARYDEKTAARGGGGTKGIGSPRRYTARDDGDGMETQPFSSLRAPTRAKQSRLSPFPLLREDRRSRWQW